jgi:NAD(P)-dependent dehydrogenase (short-subunit alcohol dehydrogenase family)
MGTPGARVVTVTSFAHWYGAIVFRDLQATRFYNPIFAYCQSKLANLLFAYELQRRFEALGAQALSTASHPGWTTTGLYRNTTVYGWLNPVLGQGLEDGVLPTLYAATHPEMRGGELVGPRGFLGLRGAPRVINSSKRSRDAGFATRLWAVSEMLTGVRFPTSN